MAKNPKISSYKSVIKGITGWNDKQYKAAYTKFAAQTRNYNAATGSHYSAAREFYYSYVYADAPSPALQGILSTPATRTHYAGSAEISTNKAVIRQAQQSLMRVWWGLYNKDGNAKMHEVYNKLKLDPDDPLYWPPRQVNEWLAQYAEAKRKAANGEAIKDARGRIIGYKGVDVTAGSP